MSYPKVLFSENKTSHSLTTPGTNFACVKLLDTHVPVAAGAAMRFGLAALASSPALLAPGGWGPVVAGLEIGGEATLYIFPIIPPAPAYTNAPRT